MNYKSEIQQFVTSQHIYSGTRIALAIVVPSVILAYLGVLKEFFLFPLGTSFVGLTDMVGPFIRRRNALLLSVFLFIFIAITATILKDVPILVYAEIVFFGIFLTMLGVYGQRLTSVGGLGLVVLSIFIDGHLIGQNPVHSLVAFSLGCIWFFVVFMVMTKLQPYKLPSQMIGENYIQLAEYLKLKSRFYQKNADIETLQREVIAKQVIIKNLQEDTREVVFKTRTIVNESTTTSRLLMLLFLNAIDLYEKLITSELNYQKLHQKFDHHSILLKVHTFLNLLAEELVNIGIALQSGTKAKAIRNINAEIEAIYQDYYQLRNKAMNAHTLEDFMSLRLVFLRLGELSNEVKTIYRVFSQDLKNAKSLSTGLDFEKFVPKQEKLNSKVFFNNFSLKSGMFRHAIRITTALLVGYSISRLEFLGIGHSYWILITIIAIMRPAYSTTKHRNILRLYGTVSGAMVAYLILIGIESDSVKLGILLSSMILCFTFLKDKYAWAVFFMTIYIFISFNFLNPGNINLIFKDRIIDTAIAGVIAFGAAYFVFPVWEHTINSVLMQKAAKSNLIYFQNVWERFTQKTSHNEVYRIARKDAIINLANLSDNFQRMLSDPKNQQKKMQAVHQFVNTSHLITAYTASLAQYANSENEFEEIDHEKWYKKISFELKRITLLLEDKKNQISEELPQEEPENILENLLQQRKQEISENEFFDIRDPKRITKLTELKNIQEILELLCDVAHEQRKAVERYLEVKQ